MKNNYEKKIRLNKIRRARQLKRRIRLFIIAALLIVGISFGFFSINAKAESKDAVHNYKYYKSVTVTCNDSLWSFASLYAPDNDYDKYINEVMRMNNLSSEDINTGMNLIIPYYSTEFIM